MLIQLPTGEWVKPELVDGVEVKNSTLADRYPDMAPFTVQVHIRNGGIHCHPFHNLDEANRVRDLTATMVNSAVNRETPAKPQKRDWSQPIVVNAGPYSIWRELFNLYRECGGNLDDMYDMLIDYDIIHETRFHSGKFAWGFLTGSGRTELRLELTDDMLKVMESSNDNLFLIEVESGKATITCLR